VEQFFAEIIADLRAVGPEVGFLVTLVETAFFQRVRARSESSAGSGRAIPRSWPYPLPGSYPSSEHWCPRFAGMSRMKYARFALYDALGVIDLGSASP
jgi:hypothetical protein